MSAAAFITARRSTDRSACERWVLAQGVAKTDATAFEAAKDTWRSLSLLSDPSLKPFALQTLSQALGGSVTAQTRFPSMIWYGGATDTYRGYAFKGTVGDFVTHVLVARSHEIAEKRCGWVVTPTTNLDGHRVNASTVEMHALNLDCDGRGHWDRLLAALEQLGLCFMAYQSGGWSPATPKWHILIPLARPFDTSAPDKIAAWKSAYTSARVIFGALAELPGEGFDPTVETPSIPIFITERRRPEDLPRQVVFREGRALDIEALVAALPQIPKEEPERAYAAPALTDAKPLDDAEHEKIVKALCEPMSKILRDRRDIYLALPGVLLDRGLSPDDVRTIVEEVSLRCPGDPRYTRSEVEQKHKEHLHCAETTISRYENSDTYTRIGTLNERWPEVARAVDDVLPDPQLAEALERLEAGRLARMSSAQRASAAPSPILTALTQSPEAFPFQAGFDVLALRRELVKLRRRKRQSRELDEMIKWSILDSLLDGKDLVPYHDGQFIADSRGRTVDRDAAIDSAMWMVASKVDLATTFEDVVELVRPSIAVMLRDGEPASELLKKAGEAFRAALRARVKSEGRKQQAETARVERQLQRRYGASKV